MIGVAETTYIPSYKEVLVIEASPTPYKTTYGNNIQIIRLLSFMVRLLETNGVRGARSGTPQSRLGWVQTCFFIISRS